jgi:hypothetical protein
MLDFALMQIVGCVFFVFVLRFSWLGLPLLVSFGFCLVVPMG